MNDRPKLKNDGRYRQRIYSAYSSARTEALAPKTIEGLRPRLPYLKQIVRRFFPADRGSSVLDLGCGHGAIVYCAQREGYSNVRGVDGSPEQVAAAKRLGISGVQLGDVMETLRELPAASLDVVVAFDVIEHFNRDELVDLVDEVLRVLRDGGRWIVHVPNGESPFGTRMLFWDLTHELAFTRTSLGQLFLASGFSSISCHEDEPVPHGPTSAVRWALWKGIRAAARFRLAVETGDTGRGAIFSQNLLAVAIK